MVYTGEKIATCRNLVGKQGGRRQFRRLELKYKNNIKMDF
jgi:hypothetical protein